MNYAFAPGRTSQDGRAREMFKRKIATTLLGRGAPNSVPPASRRAISVEQFINLLSTQSTLPADEIFIGTHGDDGYMYIPFANVSGNSAPELATYDTVAQADDLNVCNIDSAVLNTDTALRIRGCNIGQDQVYTQKVKDALGGQVLVSAPKHFHLIGGIRSCGYFEGFCYKFKIIRKLPITGNNSTEVRNAIVQAFQAESFSLLDPAISIDNSWWEIWIPSRGIPGRPPTRELKLTVPHRIRFDPPLPVTRGRPVETWNLNRISGMFRIVPDIYTWYISGINSRPSETDMVQQVHSSIKGSPGFQGGTDNPYPVHERYGVSSSDEFLDLFTWTVRYNSREKKIYGTGTRYVYIAVVPVTSDTDPTDRTKNHLIYNFYPDSNNSVPPVIQIQENDARLFQIV